MNLEAQVLPCFIPFWKVNWKWLHLLGSRSELDFGHSNFSPGWPLVRNGHLVSLRWIMGFIPLAAGLPQVSTASGRKLKLLESLQMSRYRDCTCQSFFLHLRMSSCEILDLTRKDHRCRRFGGSALSLKKVVKIKEKLLGFYHPSSGKRSFIQPTVILWGCTSLSQKSVNMWPKDIPKKRNNLRWICQDTWPSALAFGLA